MKNKKGFTLVELLAVVVILGVLLLIAVPAVSNLIRSSKRRSFESTAKLAIENVETLASFDVQEHDAITECYVPLSDISLSRGSWGTSPTGYVIVSSSGVGTIYYSNAGFSTSGTIQGGFTTYANGDSNYVDDYKSTPSAYNSSWTMGKCNF